MRVSLVTVFSLLTCVPLTPAFAQNEPPAAVRAQLQNCLARQRGLDQLRARASGLRDRISLSRMESAFKYDCGALMDEYAAPPAGSAAASGSSGSATLDQPCERVKTWLGSAGGFVKRLGFTTNVIDYQAIRTAQLLQDEYFAPSFGRPYDRFSLAEINNLRLQVLSCDVGGTDKTHVLEIFSVDAYSRNVATVVESRPASEELSALTRKLETAKDASDPDNTLSDLMAEASAPSTKAPGRNAMAFYDRLAAIRLDRDSGSERTKIEAQMRTAASLVDLIHLDEAAKSIDQRMPKLSTQADATQWTSLREQLRGKMHDVSVNLAADELASYRTIENGGETLDSLAKATHRENEAIGRYGSILQWPEFAAFNQERSAYRPKALARQSAALVADISRQSEPTGVAAIIDQYTLETDSTSPGGASVKTAAEKRYDELLPFRHLSGGAYLSTVYRGDKDGVRRADVEYFRDIRSLLTGGVNGALSGGNNPMRNMINQAFDRISLVEPVLAVYLLNYQNTSSRCLRPGYETITIETTTTRVKSRFGMEVAREVIDRDVSSYKVNKEFVSAFHELATADPDAGTLADTLMNGGKMTALLAGTRDMMKQFPCDDPRIARFEKNLLALYKAMNQ